MFGWKGALRQKTRRSTEVSGACDGTGAGVMSGIIATTKVATAIGWREVGSLQVGDQVLTFDNALQTLKSISRTQLWDGEGACPRDFWPLSVPAGALENIRPMMLLGKQGVMLESDIAEELYGDPFALIPAAALEGVHGIERVYPNDPIEVITLHFEEAQVVFAENGTLMFCAAGGDLLEMAAKPKTESKAYNMLPERNASKLVQDAPLSLCA